MRELDNYYGFEIITGPMSCGKTEELLRRIRRFQIAQKNIKIISPDIDTREGENRVASRNGLSLDAIKVKTSREVLDVVEEKDEIIAIDEIQFFDEEIVDVVNELVSQHKKVIACGLDLDFKAEPFGPMPQLLAIANRVDKLMAICMKCGSEYGVRTQRLINGAPAGKNSPQIMIGGDETYEARCLDCYEPPAKVSRPKLSVVQ
ncbi:thymidine kinase [bacterium]|nr:thymidine kinase [bacterium]